jgi:acylphosphatase
MPAVAETRQGRRYLISGSVQGVGYRFFARQVAERLSISGFVRNRYDSRVEVYAIGRPEQLSALRAELARGPWAAGVEKVEEEAVPLDPHYADGFAIEDDV